VQLEHDEERDGLKLIAPGAYWAPSRLLLKAGEACWLSVSCWVLLKLPMREFLLCSAIILLEFMLI
jgi:hypothetical protein